ncbi:MAG: EAL domain-containing protein [Gammaproteobacteria bacterium]|nr:EAL domain-containing protein [Gammaproteobacteria bacterium]
MLLVKKLKDHTNHFQQNITSELIQLLYSQATAAIVGSLIVASCLVYGLYGIVPNEKLFGWYALMLVVMLARYALAKVYFKKNPPPTACTLWKNLFIAMSALAGVSWSLVGSLLMPESSIHQTFIACSLAGVSAGAVPHYSGSRVVCFVFVVPLLLPFAVWSLMQGTMTHQLLGLLTFLYLGLLLISCWQTHSAIYNAIKLKFENDELVNHLTSAQNEMAMINQELNGEINERKLAERLLRESEEQYRLVTDALPVLISYIDMQLYYRFNNKAHEDWFSKSLNEINDKKIEDVLDRTGFEIFKENFAKLQMDKSITYETTMHFRATDERYVSVTLIPHIKDGKMQGVFSLISDMTPRINYLATHDSLTDLPNRSLFTARFSQALTRAERNGTEMALLFLDLDHFKNINDTLGHDVGDNLLIKVAERIKNSLRDGDTLARLGGDEFTIILEKINAESVIVIANKICCALRGPFKLDGREIFISTSIGISVYPGDGTDMQILLKNADMAIYRAKERGRNTFQFYMQEMNDKIIKKINIESNLRSAIKNEELEVYYQPVMDIASNMITSLEALLRWQHPKLGYISPVEFIPVAEEAGLIVSIGEWVMRTACRQNLEWIKNMDGASIKPRMAINLSARQFKECNLVERMELILKETGLSGEYVTLELTESLIMNDIEHNTKVINKFKDLGISISIDDFGTGYSSLSYLRRFPIDTIKIDRSFITDINKTEKPDDAAAIVTAIIAMAQSLKMKVVAEGVETMEQYAFLSKLGCDQIQGYLLSPAVAADEVSNFLRTPFSIEDYFKLNRFRDFKNNPHDTPITPF